MRTIVTPTTVFRAALMRTAVVLTVTDVDCDALLVRLFVEELHRMIITEEDRGTYVREFELSCGLVATYVKRRPPLMLLTLHSLLL